MLTLTAEFDEDVQVRQGQTFAPTLTIGTETGISLTPGITSGKTRTWTYTINKTDSTAADNGKVLVEGLGTSFLAKLEDAAGNPVANTANKPTSISETYTVDTTAPGAPTLALGSGVSGGATAAEATQSSGVLWLHAESGNTVVLTFSDSTSPTTPSPKPSPPTAPLPRPSPSLPAILATAARCCMTAPSMSRQ